MTDEKAAPRMVPTDTNLRKWSHFFTAALVGFQLPDSRVVREDDLALVSLGLMLFLVLPILAGTLISLRTAARREVLLLITGTGLAASHHLACAAFMGMSSQGSSLVNLRGNVDAPGARQEILGPDPEQTSDVTLRTFEGTLGPELELRRAHAHGSGSGSIQTEVLATVATSASTGPVIVDHLSYEHSANHLESIHPDRITRLPVIPFQRTSYWLHRPQGDGACVLVGVDAAGRFHRREAGWILLPILASLVPLAFLVRRAPRPRVAGVLLLAWLVAFQPYL